ncbi:GDSL-type esterase/lipase family protein [Flavobacterium sp. J27]|uniref:GDSL-type esterase/lipase family protein n=1 Tax=Flavobacterium sp. J27 TaxID=2060419 RepID=UPI0010325E7A|nr:GDSL-type esterase/lipase family protein [Flavobacterium sp. J27]
MKKTLLLILIIFSYTFQCKAQSLDQFFLVDFGPSTGTNGSITSSPDTNSNYWNNCTNGSLSSISTLINSNNTASNYTLEVTDSFVVNTNINYGPTNTSSNLEELAISTATQDYFYLETGGSANATGALKLGNLNPSKAYQFSVFASRPTSSVRISNYTFTGSSTYSNQIQTSDGSTGNLTTILTTPLLYPNNLGNITINLSIAQGGFAYINAIKIEEYNVPTVEVTTVQVTGNDITISGQASQMNAIVSPANATFPDVNWSIDNSSIASISNTGLVTPIQNGSIIVTATSVQNPSISDSKTITISNQTTKLYFSGSTTENGDNPATAIPMRMVTNSQNNVTNIFELYTSLNPSGTFNFYTSLDTNATVYGNESGAGTLAINGPGIDPIETGPVLITVDLNTNTYTILPINWSVVGSTITNSWNGDEPLTYQNNGIWSGTIQMNVVNTDTNPRFVFKGNNSWNYVMKKVSNNNNTVIMESQGNAFNIPFEDIDLNYGVFQITLNLQNYTYNIECIAIDNHKISIMGSSVSNGQGATSNQGYAYKYGQLLIDRFSAGIGSEWTTSNLAINGNNTIAVLNRWEKDLIADCSQFVIYGLSLGNEGIHENGQSSFDQFSTNMQLLITKAEQEGKTPVIMNNYTRADYNATDYNYIKQMNLLIHQWNVASVNLLGAIDNGSGQWATGYQDDALHPNDAGHTEFFYAIVPSLFDALELQKPLPQLITSTYLEVNNAFSSGSLEFTPEHIIHPFTNVIDIKTNATGTLFSFTTQTATTGTLSIDSNGHLVYNSPSGNTITSNTIINDNQWHKISLSHFYARGETNLYIDSNLVGSYNENLEVETFTLNPVNAPNLIQYRNWFFYRSGMNLEEITALHNNQMLKSSLELYAPLDGEEILGNNPYINLAQSTNTIDSTTFSLGLINYNNEKWKFNNPVQDSLTIQSTDHTSIKKLEVYTLLGQKIKSTIESNTIHFSNLSSGLYVVKIYSEKEITTIKIIKK